MTSIHLRTSLLLAAALLLAACSKDEPSPSVGVTPLSSSPESTEIASGPGAALTPQAGLNVDLQTARQFESEGDIERAAAAYIAVAAGKSSDRDAATLAAGRLLLELERPEDARLLLDAFLGRSDLAGEDLAARYLLARAYAALDMWAESLQQYDLYLASGRPALPYADLDRAQALIALERPQDAVASVQTGNALGVPNSMQRSFLLAIAQGNERAGAIAAAISGYRDVINSGTDASLALSRIVALKRQQGDASYADDLLRLLAGYPSSAEALAALQEADAKGDAVASTIRGLIHYRHNDYGKAEPFFRQQVAQAPNAVASAEAYYYLAAIQESRGENANALANYARAAQLNPQSFIADDALWWRARILEIDDALDDAAGLYVRIVSEYPLSQFASDAAFREGMLDYRRGDFAGAAAEWGASAAVIGGAERSRLQIWQAKAQLKAGATSEAASVLQPMTVTLEDDYPGVRAQALLQAKHELPVGEAESNLDLEPKFDWSAAEAWLTQRAGRSISDAGWSADRRWARAQELWLVGRTAYGDAEMFDLIEAYAGDSIAMYTMARRLDEMGRASMSARAGQRLLRVLNTNPNAGLPKPLLSLSYPAVFGPLVRKHAAENGVSPLLMLAFIRQESFFDPRAESPAGALGLTQVIPETGASLASSLNVADFEAAQLLHADLNLRFGARYMADQLKKFNGELFVAFAAYNAGPTAATRWREASGNDADLFLETVEFSETRLYVEIVAENYAIYRYLYGGQPQPNLAD